MNQLLFYLLSLIFNKLSIHAELILNPGQFSQISCGINESCYIICNETEICTGSIFNLYNSNIMIECSASQSCKNVTINTYNVISLYALFTGQGAFVQSHLFNHNTQTVTIHCNALYACELSEFYHDSTALTTHICAAEASCSHTFINCGSHGECHVICNETRSCSPVCNQFSGSTPCSDRCSSGSPTGHNSCPDTEIILHNDDIYIECSTLESCFKTLIYAYNFSSLYTLFTGQQSFDVGTLTSISNKTNSVINTNCINSEACDGATFYYHGNSVMYHLCGFNLACSHFQIVADSNASKLINCSHINSCYAAGAILKNNINKLLCPAYQACNQFTLITENVELMETIASGKRSFYGSKIWTHNTDNDINIICDGEESCIGIECDYNATGNVLHVCNGKTSCQWMNIASFTGTHIICNGSIIGHAPCDQIILVLPFDFEQLNKFRLDIIGNITLNNLDNDGRLHIYSLYGITHNQLIVTNGSLDNIVLSYGPKFNKFCWLVINDCIGSIPDINPNQIQVLNQYKYIGDVNNNFTLDFTDYQFNKQYLIIILSHLPSDLFNTELKYDLLPPSTNNNNTWISVICMDKTCAKVYMDFRSNTNVVLTILDDSLVEKSINGPSNHFIMNQFSTDVIPILYLNNTNYVQLNGVSTSALPWKIVLGNVTNMDLRCISPFSDCSQIDFYSSLNPIEIQLFKSGWNILCETDKCDIIVIHFSAINISCSYTKTDIDPRC
eukprot:226218_1